MARSFESHSGHRFSDSSDLVLSSSPYQIIEMVDARIRILCGADPKETLPRSVGYTTAFECRLIGMLYYPDWKIMHNWTPLRSTLPVQVLAVVGSSQSDYEVVVVWMCERPVAGNVSSQPYPKIMRDDIGIICQHHNHNHQINLDSR